MAPRIHAQRVTKAQKKLRWTNLGSLSSAQALVSSATRTRTIFTALAAGKCIIWDDIPKDFYKMGLRFHDVGGGDGDVFVMEIYGRARDDTTIDYYSLVGVLTLTVGTGQDANGALMADTVVKTSDYAIDGITVVSPTANETGYAVINSAFYDSLIFAASTYDVAATTLDVQVIGFE